MGFDDGLRWTWTFLNFWGVIFAIWNVREVVVDYWAIDQVDRQTRPLNVLRLQVGTEVFLHVIVLVALLANFLAGVVAIAGFPIAALIMLIVSAASLIVLSFVYAQRRRATFRALQLRRKSLE